MSSVSGIYLKKERNECPSDGPAEQLEELCEALMELFLTANGNVAGMSSLLDGLARAIGSGCDETVIALEQQRSSFKQAAESLRAVTRSPLLKPGDESEIIIRRMDTCRANLTRVLDALGSLRKIAHQTSVTSMPKLNMEQQRPRLQRPTTKLTESLATRPPQNCLELVEDSKTEVSSFNALGVDEPMANSRSPGTNAKVERATESDRNGLTLSPSAEKPTSRQTQVQMGIGCPGCGKETTIRWNRLQLGRVLGCPHCARNFSMNQSGEFQEVVKDSSGRWRPRHLLDARRRDRWHRRFQLTAGLSAALIVGIATMWTSRVGQGSSSVEPSLPTELDSRVTAFARAWMTGDSRTMRRLTDPALDRQLFPWYQRTVPPEKMTPKTLENVKIHVVRLQGSPSMTWMKARFEGLTTPDGGEFELLLAWEERSGIWLFQPNTQK